VAVARGGDCRVCEVGILTPRQKSNTFCRMVRLKKKPADKRSKVILVRVTPGERKRLEKEAKSVGVKLSEWMRRKLLG
jgi:hypothetical protein